MSDDLAPTAALGADTFRTLGHQLIERLARHLEQGAERAAPILPPVRPAQEFAHWRRDERAASADPARLLGLVDDLLARSTRLQSPRFVGHQVAAPHPLAALCELVSALLNNGMAVYEMGPAATAIERELVRWFAREFGLPEDADGLLTSGGSAGNLTALLAARELAAGFPAWEQGAHAGPPLCVLVGAQAHYSIARSAQIMGFGRAGAWPVPVDERYRLRPELLPEALRAARAAGRRPIAVVASACSTATGAFDPLEPIADFCAQEDLWLHVDGAHGAPAALSPRYRGLVAGIERADSIVVDAHKLLLVPALCTAVLFRQGRHACAAFAQEASYLFGAGAHDQGLRTLECTKRMLGLPLYALLEVLGREVLVAHVEHCFDLARAFAAELRAAPDFELAVEPQANIVCFRHVPAGATDLDALQAAVRTRVLESGRFYLVQTRLGGALWLRTTLIHPQTSLDDLRELLATIREFARGAGPAA
ncbi:MAG: pyridoxal-dependent decarboxylase [Planctomycetes bacterium]|nr:pyridoxal-dependent decarboxylase [Planctomycetota bacterium]